MAGNEVVGIDIVARLDQFRAEMGKIPGITAENAKAMASELNKSIKAVETQAKSASKGAKEAASAGAEVTKSAARSKAGLVNLGNQLSDVASQLSTGTSPFTILVQQGPQVAGALDLMGMSFAGMGVIAASALAVTAAGAVPLVAVMAGLAVASDDAIVKSNILNTALYDQAKQAKPAQEAIDKLNDAWKRFTDAASVVQADLDIINGQISKGAASAEQKSRALADMAASNLDADKAEVDRLQQQADAAAALLKTTTDAGKRADLLGALGSEGGMGIRADLKAARDKYEIDQKQLVVAQQQVAIEGEYQDALEESNRVLAERTKHEQALAEAFRAAQEAWQKEWDTTQADAKVEIDRQDAITAAIVKQIDAVRALEIAQMSAADKASAGLTDRLKAIGIEEQATLNLAHSEEERAGIREFYDARIVAETEATEAEITRIKADEAKKRAKSEETARKQQMAAVQQALSTAADFASKAADAMQGVYEHANENVTALTDQLAAGDAYYTDSQKRELQKRLEASKRAARRAFEIEKAAKIAAAVINTAAAVTSALANPPGPPYSIPQAIAAGATGAVEVATIAGQQPAFHSGYAPDEMAGPPSRMLKREGMGILTPQGITAMGGPTAVKNANAGATPSAGGQIVAVTVYKNDRQMQHVKYDAIRAGDPYTELMARNTRPWRR